VAISAAEESQTIRLYVYSTQSFTTMSLHHSHHSDSSKHNITLIPDQVHLHRTAAKRYRSQIWQLQDTQHSNTSQAIS
jgi:hypothetical protein